MIGGNHLKEYHIKPVISINRSSGMNLIVDICNDTQA